MTECNRDNDIGDERKATKIEAGNAEEALGDNYNRGKGLRGTQNISVS